MDRRAGATIAIGLVASLGAAPAAAGEPEPNRHVDARISCTTDDAFNGVVTATAGTDVRTKDMKNNTDATVPFFYKLNAKTEIQKWAQNAYGQWKWSTVDNTKWQSNWIERKSNWIVKQAQQPPYTTANAARGTWKVAFGDTTKMADAGSTVRAKFTVWLDKKPGLKQWKYERYTGWVQCPDEPGAKKNTKKKTPRPPGKKAANTPPSETAPSSSRTPGSATSPSSAGNDSGGSGGLPPSQPSGITCINDFCLGGPTEA